jgi:UDP-N-acetylglucosamine transferase subunit ALG13
MIVVTTGTNEQPFDRLVAAAGALDVEEPLLVQHGSSRVPHGAGRWVDFMSFEELEAAMRSARVVVCHAGVGSMMLARRCGLRPVVMARRVHLGEAVDDHQLPLARRLHEAGAVELVDDAAQLAAAVRAGIDRPEGGQLDVALPGVDALASELRDVLAGVGVPGRPPLLAR